MNELKDIIHNNTIDRKQKAYEYFGQGYNCAQSVVLAFEDLLPLGHETLQKVSIAFGGGFGRTRNLCGAVSAMGIILGLLSSPVGNSHTDKGDVYKQIQQLNKQFKERNNSDNCGELLANVKNITQGWEPQVRNNEYYKSRPCLKFVLDSVELLESYILVK